MPEKILFVLTVVFVLTLTGVQPVVAERWQDWGVGPVAAALRPSTPDLPEGLSEEDWASMQDLMREAQYQFTWQVSEDRWAYRAPNLAHGLNLAFAADGLTATRYDEAGEPLWDFGLSLLAYGERTFPTSIDAGGLVGHRERVEYRWGQGVTEWYVNGENGIEHGLNLHAPPPGGDVALTYDILGSLTPELDTAGQVLRLRDASGETALLYDQLAVYDATRRQLPAHFELNGTQLLIRIDAAFAVYPLTIDPLLYSQVAKLTAADGAGGDYFGYAVAVSGDTIVVGAPADDDNGSSSGSAYVFTRNQGGADIWGQAAKLTAADGAEYDRFGTSVAISGDTLVVGAYGDDDNGDYSGSAYIFTRNQGGADNWGQTAKLTATDGAVGDNFGSAVAVSGDTIVVGARYDDDNGSESGSAYVFTRNQGGADNWGQAAKLTAADGVWGDQFGFSVAVSGDTIVVGAEGDDDNGSNSGSAYVFTRNQGGADNWGQAAKLTAADGAGGDLFGHSVAVSGDTLIIGAYKDDDNGSDSGSAYIFTRNQGGADNWGQTAKLTAADGAAVDWFGFSVAVSGDSIIVGARYDNDNGSGSGSAYVFTRNQGGADNWGEAAKLTAADGAADDYFGFSVAVSSDTLVVGAYGDDDSGSDSGSAYTFFGQGSTRRQQAKPTAVDGAADDFFGYAVAVSGDTLVVGASRDDDNGSESGSAYVFTRNQGGGDNWGQATKLTAADGAANDYFGTSVAVSGDTLVVGARYDDDNGSSSGSAYVFTRNQGGADTWGQAAKLTAADGAGGDSFGTSVAVSGDTIVVGAPSDDDNGSSSGSAYVFTRNQGGADIWGQTAKLTASDGAGGDHLGTSVAVSGDTLVVGADGDDDNGSSSGSAYVFTRNQGGADIWGQAAKLTAADGAADDYFGTSVAVSGDTIVVGAMLDDDNGSASGSAYVFTRNQGGADNWGQAAKLTASDGDVADRFGNAVAISGDTIVVGAFYDNDNGGDSGSAYLFTRNQGGADIWGQAAKLTAADGAGGDIFGYAVAISGDTIAVGAPYDDDNGSSSGSAYVFTWDHNPTADTGGPYSGAEGSVISLDGSGSSDDDSIVLYEWDCTDDGAYDVSSPNPDDSSCTYPDDGAYTLRLRVTDSIGQTGEDTASVTVNNVAPTLALSGDATVDEGDIYTVTLSAVSDPGADTISACALDWGDGSPVTDCLAAIGGTMTHTYADGPSSPTISLDLTDEDGSYTGVDTLGVTVNNVAPVAVDDPYVTDEDTPLNVAAPGVLHNDSDVGGDSLTAVLNVGPVSGTLTLNGDGSFVYTPDTDYCGSDSFTYHANDGSLDSNIATVTLTVTPVSDPPIVNPTSLTVSEPGTSDAFTITLDAAPTAAVTVALSTSNSECSVGVSEVVLDGTNWNTGVAVTVSAVDDDIVDGSQTCIVVTAPTVSTDSNYVDLDADDVTVTVLDDDAPGVTVDPLTVILSEDGITDTYQVVLHTEPMADVTIAINTDGQTTVSPASLTFTVANWELSQTVEVTAVYDRVPEGSPHDGIISHVATSADSTYDGIGIDDVMAVITDLNQIFLSLVMNSYVYIDPAPAPTAVNQIWPDLADGGVGRATRYIGRPAPAR